METPGLILRPQRGRVDVTTHADKVRKSIPKDKWQDYMAEAFRLMLEDENVISCTPAEHLEGTPDRVVRMYESIFWGVKEDPRKVLCTKFKEEHCDEMVHVEDIDFVSWCSHHILPFYGKVHFAYLPDKYIVGLSKIPRLVDILAARPQVQERLTYQIVKEFQEVVGPRGCGCTVAATHMCMTVRGVKKAGARMRTTALSGTFMVPSVKAEFLKGAV